MSKVILVVTVIFLSAHCEDIALYKSPVDSIVYRPVFHKVREILFNIVGRTGQRKHGHFFQEPFPDVVDFPCHLVNVISQDIPTSVHKLRPGDIDVIAAMGDSLTAGSGAAATTFYEIAVDNRGLSWSIGGQWDWRNATTLPNILKKFNPNIIGYSMGDALPFHNDAQFNVAEVAATIENMPVMAEVLVKRIENDHRVDFNSSWKMLTILIGGNDFCTKICTLEYPEKFPEAYRKKMYKTLNYLMHNLPRTFVNLVPIPPLHDAVLLDDKPERCELLQLLECSCWLGNLYNQTDERRDLYRTLQHQVWQIQKDLAQMFRGLDNFTVVYQPFSEKFSLENEYGYNDFSLVAFDCFHMSQKGHAWAGTSLWNNLLEPSGNKSKQWVDPRKKFLCPTDQSPYFHTYDNDNYNSPS